MYGPTHNYHRNGTLSYHAINMHSATLEYTKYKIRTINIRLQLPARTYLVLGHGYFTKFFKMIQLKYPARHPTVYQPQTLSFLLLFANHQ